LEKSGDKNGYGSLRWPTVLTHRRKCLLVKGEPRQKKIGRPWGSSNPNSRGIEGKETEGHEPKGDKLRGI